MRIPLLVFSGLLVLLAGCGRESDAERLEEAFQQDPFVVGLLGAPDFGGAYAVPGSSDGDTSVPVRAWRAVAAPAFDYQLRLSKPTARADFAISWPCTLFVVFTDDPDTTIRDTIRKPAPLFHGTMTSWFELAGEDWQMTRITPCHVESDSALGKIEIESVQVKVRRAGQTVVYPTLRDSTVLFRDSLAYQFRTGDSVDLRLWESNGVNYAWAYLHGPQGDNLSQFRQDSVLGKWYGTWVVNTPGRHWVWLQVIDVWDAIIVKSGPDRAALWGLPCEVE